MPYLILAGIAIVYWAVYTRWLSGRGPDREESFEFVFYCILFLGVTLVCCLAVDLLRYLGIWAFSMGADTIGGYLASDLPRFFACIFAIAVSCLLLFLGLLSAGGAVLISLYSIGRMLWKRFAPPPSLVALACVACGAVVPAFRFLFSAFPA